MTMYCLGGAARWRLLSADALAMPSPAHALSSMQNQKVRTSAGPPWKGCAIASTLSTRQLASPRLESRNSVQLCIWPRP